MTDAEIIAELRQTVARHREERERLQTALDAAGIPRQDIQLRIERLVCLNAAAPDLLAAAKALVSEVLDELPFLLYRADVDTEIDPLITTAYIRALALAVNKADGTDTFPLDKSPARSDSERGSG